MKLEIYSTSLNFYTLIAVLVGLFLTLSSYCFVLSLLVFFFTSSKATKFRQNLKKKFEEDFKEGQDFIMLLEEKDGSVIKFV